MRRIPAVSVTSFICMATMIIKNASHFTSQMIEISLKKPYRRLLNLTVNTYQSSSVELLCTKKD